MNLQFSIIIPVKAINNYVRETIPYIQKLTCAEWELFVVPNELGIDEWSNDSRIKIIPSGKVGPADKRDLAAQKAEGDILVFLDDDSYPEINLLQIASQYFEDGEIIAIGGPGITPPTDKFWQRVSGAVFLSRFTGGSPERYVPVGQAREVDDWPSVNLMVRRKEFLEIGGFDSKYWPGEDTKLCLKLKTTDKKLLYAPNMIVWHHRSVDLSSHLRQIGAYGFHRGYFARHYPQTSFRLKYFLPTGFVFFILATIGVLSLQIEALTTLIILGWVIYVGVFVIGLIEVMKFEKLSVMLALIIYVPLTHLYYGVRFFFGYLKQGELISKLR